MDGLGRLLAFARGLPLVACAPRRVWHGLATVLDSMRESIHAPSRWLLVPPRYTEQADQIEVSYACAPLIDGTLLYNTNPYMNLNHRCSLVLWSVRVERTPWHQEMLSPPEPIGSNVYRGTNLHAGRSMSEGFALQRLVGLFSRDAGILVSR